MIDRGPFIVFCTDTYAYLADRICTAPTFERGKIEHHLFPDGEHYRRILTDCAGRDVILIGGTVSELDTVSIYDVSCALVHQGIHTLTLVIPYFGYQTMERALHRGEVVTAKTRAELLSSIPTAGSGNRVVLVDLHLESIAHYFSGTMRPVHLSARPIALRQIRALGGDDFIVGATDAGRAKWVESIANDLNVDAGFVFKRRLSGSKTEVTAMAADVSGRTVVIYDDMIRTGGSLIGAAQAYLDAGATKIAAVTSHGVFPGDALARLTQCGHFSGIACTDSHPRALDLSDGAFLRVESIAPLLAECLRSNR